MNPSLFQAIDAIDAARQEEESERLEIGARVFKALVIRNSDVDPKDEGLGMIEMGFLQRVIAMSKERGVREYYESTQARGVKASFLNI